jgi:hypothetical protein
LEGAEDDDDDDDIEGSKAAEMATIRYCVQNCCANTKAWICYLQEISLKL